MALIIWPREFEKKIHIIKEEKALLRAAKNNFKNGHFVVGIDPLGMCTPQNHMGLFISPKEGLLTFSIFTGNFDEGMDDLYITMVENYERKIYTRLSESKILISRLGQKKVLKFPYKHILVFANLDRRKIKCADELRKKLAPYVALHTFTPIDNTNDKLKIRDLHLFKGIRHAYDKNFVSLGEKECRAVFERLCPEYVVVTPEIEETNILTANKSVVPEEALYITGQEKEYRTFFLDDEQVNLVNDMGKGHRVLLANPGAGKSVLLLAKAFKYASMYKDSKVLLTCYNSNLADAYVFKQGCADYGDNNNLFIMTFHKLVRKIFNDCLRRSIVGNIASPEEIDECIALVKSGNVKLRFKAIFIDEVQIFEPQYLELCYSLLELPLEDSVFLMAGDLNQTVRAQSRRGDAPWKKIAGIALDFKGRVKYIKKNYRNTKDIGDYLNNVLAFMNQKMQNLGIMIPSEYDYNSFETNYAPSTALCVKSGISRMKITREVLQAIYEISAQYHIAYSDISVIFPYRQMRLLKYFFMFWLGETLDAEGIPYCTIISSAGDRFRRYGNTSGIVLTTIDSSLGLDFKAVIVAGLYPYNYLYLDRGKKIKIKTWKQVEQLDIESKEQFMIEVRKTYTAASRARDVLYILSDLDPGTPLDDIINQ